MRIPFGTGAYKLGDSADFSAQRMVNAYLEAAPPGSEAEYYVRQNLGIDDWATPGTGLLRGGNVIRAVLYVVVATTAYSIASDGTATSLGSVPGTDHVQIVGDETNVVFLADRTMYQWDGATITEVTDVDAPETDWLAVVAGYYIGSQFDTGQFYISANRDPSSWEALDFASAEQEPDDIVTGIESHGELMLFGTDGGEGFYNSGNADFPFERIQSADWEIGIAGVRALTKWDNSVAFVGKDYIVYRMNGYTPARISEHSIETRLKNATDKDFRLMSWTEQGHKFLALTCDDFTFVFDPTTQLWHERQSDGETNWRPLFILSAYQKLIAGDALSNALGEMTSSVFTEWGDTITSTGTCPPISDENKVTFHDRLEMLFESGLGGNVSLRWSNDRGRNWSNTKTRSLGTAGDYAARSVWNRLGQAHSRIYEWSLTVRRALIGAFLNREPGEY